MAKKTISAQKVRIRLKRSLISEKPIHRKTIKALGLGKINSIVEKDMNPAIMGMIRSVSHLVEFEEI